MLLDQIDSAGVQLTVDDWRHVRAEHDSGVGRLEGLLRLSPQLLKDSAATPDARVRLAMAHMEGYLDAAVTQTTELNLDSPHIRFRRPHACMPVQCRLGRTSSTRIT